MSSKVENTQKRKVLSESGNKRRQTERQKRRVLLSNNRLIASDYKKQRERKLVSRAQQSALHEQLHAAPAKPRTNSNTNRRFRAAPRAAYRPSLPENKPPREKNKILKFFDRIKILLGLDSKARAEEINKFTATFLKPKTSSIVSSDYLLTMSKK